MEFKPDFNRLKKVLLREGEPDILPFYELFTDDEVIQAVTGKKAVLKTKTEFYYRLEYDYVPVDTGPGYQWFDLKTRDTAEISRGHRSYMDNNHGMIENRTDFERYPWPELGKWLAEPVIETAGDMPEGMKAVPTIGGILETVMWIMGYVPLSYALYEDEQLLWDMFEKIGRNQIALIEICLNNTDLDKIGAVAFGDDMGFKHSTMLSPELMRKFVFPWQKAMVDTIHKYELPCIMHSCGNLEAIMDDIIDYVGIDAKHSYEDVIMPVTEAKKKYGGRIAILGGIDINTLCLGSEEEVGEYVRKVVEACAPGGGYALGTGNSMTNYIPVKNYFAMLREGRKKGNEVYGRR